MMYVSPHHSINRRITSAAKFKLQLFVCRKKALKTDRGKTVDYTGDIELKLHATHAVQLQGSHRVPAGVEERIVEATIHRDLDVRQLLLGRLADPVEQHNRRSGRVGYVDVNVARSRQSVADQSAPGRQHHVVDAVPSLAKTCT